LFRLYLYIDDPYIATVFIIEGYNFITTTVSTERITNMIYLVRGQKVMFDKDLAELYEVSTSAMNKAVSRNMERFPEDFMFRLTNKEVINLKFHFGTSIWGGTRKLPRAFTEQGVAMLSSILRSKRAAYEILVTPFTSKVYNLNI